jgi:hypothetical protein
MLFVDRLPRPLIAVIGAAALSLVMPLLALQSVTASAAPACAATGPDTAYAGGDGSTSDPFLISTAGHLLKLSGDSSNWGEHFEQTADIDMSGCAWTPIAPVWATPFTGTYDGGGKAILGLEIDLNTTATALGLFGYGHGMTVRDLEIEVTVRVADANRPSGGIVGEVRSNGISVTRVGVTVNIDRSSSAEAGGVLGFALGRVVLEDVAVSGAIRVDGSNSHAGGFAGSICYWSSPPILIKDSSVSANIEGGRQVGGVVGTEPCSFGGTTLRVENTTVDGRIVSTGVSSGSGAGGVTAYHQAKLEIIGVTVGGGEISSTGHPANPAGGLIGQSETVGNSNVIERSVVTAPVITTGSFAGCLIGVVDPHPNAALTVTDSYARNTVSIGGVVSRCPFPPEPRVQFSAATIGPGESITLTYVDNLDADDEPVAFYCAFVDEVFVPGSCAVNTTRPSFDIAESHPLQWVTQETLAWADLHAGAGAGDFTLRVYAPVCDLSSAMGSTACVVQQGAAPEVALVRGFADPYIDETTVTISAASPAATSSSGRSFVLAGGALPLLAPGLGQWVDVDGSTVSMAVSSPRPNEVRYVVDGVEVTLAGGVGSDTSRGVIADANGEIVCTLCSALTPGAVIEVWMFSSPRLVAAHEVDGAACQTFAIPMADPLDGGGAVAAGAHTLQLALPTASGLQAVNVGVTVGGPVPVSVPAGEGPVGQVTRAWGRLFLLLGLLGGVGAAMTSRRERGIVTG